MRVRDYVVFLRVFFCLLPEKKETFLIIILILNFFPILVAW